MFGYREFRDSALPILILISINLIWSASTLGQEPSPDDRGNPSVELVVLGIAQDAGFPQAGCNKRCCQAAWNDSSLRRHVSSIGLIDHPTGKRWLIDCTPDFPVQLRKLNEVLRRNGTSPAKNARPLDGIFLTHAHIGHYAGLVHLGREVMGSNQIPTYAMPRMTDFLKNNAPWSQLVKLENIELRTLHADQTIRLSDRLTITPFLVPHRDEFSETVGFKIVGPSKTVVFLPDIDKWSRWDRSIESLLEQVDLAYLDGTFFENGEIPGRDMSLIPHPFVAESINRFSALDETERKKVRFIHFNHTNPVLQSSNGAKRQIEQAGMAIATEGEVIELGSK